MQYHVNNNSYFGDMIDYVKHNVKIYSKLNPKPEGNCNPNLPPSTYKYTQVNDVHALDFIEFH